MFLSPQAGNHFQGSQKVGRGDEQDPPVVSVIPDFRIFLDGHQVSWFNRQEHHDEIEGLNLVDIKIILIAQFSYVVPDGIKVFLQILLSEFRTGGIYQPFIGCQ